MILHSQEVEGSQKFLNQPKIWSVPRVINSILMQILLMSTNSQGLCFTNYPEPDASCTMEASYPSLAHTHTHSSGTEAAPELSHVTATVPEGLNGRKWSRAKQKNHQATFNEACLPKRRHLLKAQLLGFSPTSKMIYHPHATSFWPIWMQSKFGLIYLAKAQVRAKISFILQRRPDVIPQFSRLA